jgi:chromosome segregation ATPase
MTSKDEAAIKHLEQEMKKLELQKQKQELQKQELEKQIDYGQQLFNELRDCEEALKKAEDKKIGWELTVQVARSRLDEAQKNLVDSTGELDYVQSKYDDLIAKIRTF